MYGKFRQIKLEKMKLKMTSVFKSIFNQSNFNLTEF